MATLLLVHAHPDDEGHQHRGAMMKAKADGHRVVLVTATRGEVGEIYNMRGAGTPDELITTRVDVHEFVDRKRRAFRAHVSQNDPNSWFATIQDQVYELAFGTEHYQLARGKPGSPLPEPDLFAGIDS